MNVSTSICMHVSDEHQCKMYYLLWAMLKAFERHNCREGSSEELESVYPAQRGRCIQLQMVRTITYDFQEWPQICTFVKCHDFKMSATNSAKQNKRMHMCVGSPSWSNILRNLLCRQRPYWSLSCSQKLAAPSWKPLCLRRLYNALTDISLRYMICWVDVIWVKVKCLLPLSRSFKGLCKTHHIVPFCSLCPEPSDAPHRSCPRSQAAQMEMWSRATNHRT